MTNNYCYGHDADYDHEFTCLSQGLDPDQTSIEEASREIQALSASSFIKLNSDRLSPSLRPHVDLLAQEFDWRGYRQRNMDLKGLNPRQLLEHFIEHGITEPRGWRLDTKLLDRRFAWCIQSRSDYHLRSSIQVVVHCYHYSVLCYQLSHLRALARLGAKIHIYVANHSIAGDAINGLLQSLQIGGTQHSWCRVENFGEDWPSFHQAYRGGLFSGEGITIKMQTKLSSSLGADGGTAWIDDALSPLCSSYQSINRLLKKLLEEKFLIVASRSVKKTGYGANPDLINDYCRRMNIDDIDSMDKCPFAAGSMFAASNSYIQRFYEALGENDYSMASPNGTRFCGRYAGHALERVFFYYANQLNQGSSVAWVA